MTFQWSLSGDPPHQPQKRDPTKCTERHLRRQYRFDFHSPPTLQRSTYLSPNNPSFLQTAKMVLSDLGRRINAAVSDLTRAPNLDEKAFDAMIKEICNALVQSDVNIKLVSGLRKSIKQSVNFKELSPGVNKKRIIQKAVFDELVKLVDPHNEPYKPKKGKPNVIMFVGLQGAGKTTTCTKLARWYAARAYAIFWP